MYVPVTGFASVYDLLPVRHQPSLTVTTVLPGFRCSSVHDVEARSVVGWRVRSSRRALPVHLRHGAG